MQFKDPLRCWPCFHVGCLFQPWRWQTTYSKNFPTLNYFLFLLEVKGPVINLFEEVKVSPSQNTEGWLHQVCKMELLFERMDYHQLLGDLYATCSRVDCCKIILWEMKWIIVRIMAMSSVFCFFSPNNSNYQSSGDFHWVNCYKCVESITAGGISC